MVIDGLRCQLGYHHHLKTPYAPWSNGTVEVVNRMIGRTLKRLRPDESDSSYHFFLVALNQMPSDRLGKRARVTVFTALPATTPVPGFVNPQTKEFQTVDQAHADIHENLRLNRLRQKRSSCFKTQNLLRRWP